ncbi:MAG: signal peptide peptidase SppA [Candidatus Micrarchaeia archaeon]|jgi:protease-4
MAGKARETDYLLAAVGGLFLLAIIVLVAFSLLPSDECIGVVEISGPLVTTDIPSSLFTDEQKGSQTIASELEEAGSRDDVRAVLLLIDSPGGSVIASQEVYASVRALNKTSVAFIREMAASGGYYAAAGTDYIVANPDALTGSIGARATLDDYSGLMGKLGINSTTFKTGDLKDMGSTARPISEKEQAVWQSIVNESFLSFRSAVEEGRAGRLDQAGFEEALDARILTGRQAKRIGLLAELGNRDAAIAAAARLSGMEVAEGESPKLCGISSGARRGTLFGSLSAQALQLFLQSASGFHVSYR